MKSDGDTGRAVICPDNEEPINSAMMMNLLVLIRGKVMAQ
jgi:hypothetical protein